MLVFVLNRDGNPLMPWSPPTARHLLKSGAAKVVRRDPFTIKLLFGSRLPARGRGGDGYRQQDAGCAAIANGQVLYQAEVALRHDVSRKMEQRATYRRTRRGSKTRYRRYVGPTGLDAGRWPARTLNPVQGREPSPGAQLVEHSTRAMLEGGTGVLRHPQDHESGRRRRGLPGRRPEGFLQRQGAVLHRDGYECQSGRKIKHCAQLHVHHIVFRSNEAATTVEPDHAMRDVSRRPSRRQVRFEGKRTRPGTQPRSASSKVGSRGGWEFSPHLDTRPSSSASSALAGPRDTPPTPCRSAARKERSSPQTHALRNDTFPRRLPADNRPRSEQRIPTGNCSAYGSSIWSDPEWCRICQGQAIHRLFRNRRRRWRPE